MFDSIRDTFEPADSLDEPEEMELAEDDNAEGVQELVTSTLLGAIPKEKSLEKILAYRIKEGSDPPVYEFFVKWKVPPLWCIPKDSVSLTYSC